MKRLLPILLSAAIGGAALSAGGAAGDLLAHFTFDDAGNNGLNLLRATVGEDAIVRATQANAVEGIGAIEAVTDGTMLDGLAAGDGAVSIPKGQYLAVPVPGALAAAAGRPYTVEMTLRVPAEEDWRCLLNMPASNDTDAMVFLDMTNRTVCLKQFDKGGGTAVATSGAVAADTWTTLTFGFGETFTAVHLDGAPIFCGTSSLAGSYADCSRADGYLLVGADDNGDDGLFYLSDFRVYESAEDPGHAISSVADWDAFAAAVNSGTDTFAGRTVTLAADIGPITNSVGTVDHPFGGTFDGGSHTLTVAIESAQGCAAPFSEIDGATISNLVVAGTVSGGNHSAGLVGACGTNGLNTIRDCTVSAEVSGAAFLGGIVGHGRAGELRMEGCVFEGSLSGFTKFAGGLMGWCDALTLDIRDCLVKGMFSPGAGGLFHPIACKDPVKTVSATAGSAYYLNTLEPTATGNNLVPGAGGTPASPTRVSGEWWYPVTAADGAVYYLAEPPGGFQAWDGTISSETDWELFAAGLKSGAESYETKNVILAADIPVTAMAGTADHPFRGTFDGGGHTLTVAIADNDNPFAAPFSRIDGATISNLVVGGTVSSSQNHAAGLVGGCGVTAPNAIRDCIVSVAVDGAPYAGGIVGHGGQGELTLEGCVFDGSVSGFTQFAGGLMGWCDALTLDIRDCLVTGAFTPGDGGQYHPIACKFANRDVAATVTNAYYLRTLVPTATGGNLIPGADGTPVSAFHVTGEWPYPVTAADGRTYYVSDSAFAFGRWLDANAYAPCAEADPAANGLTCFQNFIADTDPAATNALEILFPDPADGDGEFILRNASANRWYVLDYSTNLLGDFVAIDLGRGQPGDWRIPYPVAQGWFGRVRARLAEPDWRIANPSGNRPAVDVLSSEEDVRAAVCNCLQLQKNDGTTQELPEDFAIHGEINLYKGNRIYPITVSCVDPDGITQRCDVEFKVKKIKNPLRAYPVHEKFEMTLKEASKSAGIHFSSGELYRLSPKGLPLLFKPEKTSGISFTFRAFNVNDGSFNFRATSAGTCILTVSIQPAETDIYEASPVNVRLRFVISE